MDAVACKANAPFGFLTHIAFGLGRSISGPIHIKISTMILSGGYKLERTRITHVHGDRTSSHQTEYHVGLGDIRKKGTYLDCCPSTLPFLHRNRSSDRGPIARQTLNAIGEGGRIRNARGFLISMGPALHIYTYDHAGHSSLYQLTWTRRWGTHQLRLPILDK